MHHKWLLVVHTIASCENTRMLPCGIILPMTHTIGLPWFVQSYWISTAEDNSENKDPSPHWWEMNLEATFGDNLIHLGHRIIVFYACIHTCIHTSFYQSIASCTQSWNCTLLQRTVLPHLKRLGAAHCLGTWIPGVIFRSTLLVLRWLLQLWVIGNPLAQRER